MPAVGRNTKNGEFSEDLTVQLLLMAARRAELLGWSTEDLAELLRVSRG